MPCLMHAACGMRQEDVAVTVWLRIWLWLWLAKKKTLNDSGFLIGHKISKSVLHRPMALPEHISHVFIILVKFYQRILSL